MRISKNRQVVDATKLQAQANAIVTGKSLVAVMPVGGLILKNGNDLSDPAKRLKNKNLSWRAFLLTMLKIFLFGYYEWQGSLCENEVCDW